MQTFSALLPLLENAARELPPAEAPFLPGQIQTWIAALPFRELSAADAACRQYAASLTWPAVSSAVLVQLHFRVQMATVFAQKMGGQTIPAGDGQDAIEFVLVEVWWKSAIEWAGHFFGSPPDAR